MQVGAGAAAAAPAAAAPAGVAGTDYTEIPHTNVSPPVLVIRFEVAGGRVLPLLPSPPNCCPVFNYTEIHHTNVSPPFLDAATDMV